MAGGNFNVGPVKRGSGKDVEFTTSADNYNGMILVYVPLNSRIHFVLFLLLWIHQAFSLITLQGAIACLSLPAPLPI